MKNYLIGLIILVVLVGAFLLMRNSGAQSPLPTIGPSSPSPLANTSPTPAARTKFSDYEFANVSYQIYPGPLSSQAKQATSDYTIKSQVQTDGTVNIDLIPKEKEDQAQHFTLKSGEKLYFVEKNLADDLTVDANLGDDMGIVVDAGGFMVSQ